MVRQFFENIFHEVIEKSTKACDIPIAKTSKQANTRANRNLPRRKAKWASSAVDGGFRRHYSKVTVSGKLVSDLFVPCSRGLLISIASSVSVTL